MFGFLDKLRLSEMTKDSGTRTPYDPLRAYAHNLYPPQEEHLWDAQTKAYVEKLYACSDKESLPMTIMIACRQDDQVCQDQVNAPYRAREQRILECAGPMPPAPNKNFKFQHPMLKQGLVKGKK